MTEGYCLWCHKKLKSENTFMSMFWYDDVLCEACRQKMNYFPMTFKIDGLKVRSLYVYEGVTREMLLQFKEMGDEALYPVFLYPYVKELRKRFKSRALVSIPSSDKRNMERGFKHVEKIYSMLDLPVYGILSKKDNIDQKERTLRERKKIGEHFELRDERIPYDKAILVDDIITSGETMKAAYNLIKDKFREVEGFALASNKSYIVSNTLLNLVYKLN